MPLTRIRTRGDSIRRAPTEPGRRASPWRRTSSTSRTGGGAGLSMPGCSCEKHLSLPNEPSGGISLRQAADDSRYRAFRPCLPRREGSQPVSGPIGASGILVAPMRDAFVLWAGQIRTFVRVHFRSRPMTPKCRILPLSPNTGGQAEAVREFEHESSIRASVKNACVSDTRQL